MFTDVFTSYKANNSTFSPILVKQFGAFDGLMLSALLYWQCSQKLYNNDFFEYNSKDLQVQTGLQPNDQLLAIHDLAITGALETKPEGVPAKLYIKLNLNMLKDLFDVSEANATKINNIKQFKQLSNKPKASTKGKSKFQQFYSIATEKFSDKDLLDLLYKYLKEKIGAISKGQWEVCLKHLEEAGLQYAPQVRKAGMLLMVEKAIAGGWFDFYKVSDYELQQHTQTGYNQFGESVQNNRTTGDIDEWGKNCNFDLAVDENGNPIKF